jgi:hypothetical protein
MPRAVHLFLTVASVVESCQFVEEICGMYTSMDRMSMTRAAPVYQSAAVPVRVPFQSGSHYAGFRWEAVPKLNGAMNVG